MSNIDTFRSICRDAPKFIKNINNANFSKILFRVAFNSSLGYGNSLLLVIFQQTIEKRGVIRFQ